MGLAGQRRRIVEAGSPMLSRRLFLGTMSAAGLIAIAGCRSAVEEAESGAAAGEEAGEVVRGGTLVAAIAAEPIPGAYFTGRPGNVYWCRCVLEALVIVDENFEVQPGLATEWEFLDGNTAWVAQLQEGVTFHSGREFTAEDAVFALQHAAEGGGLTQHATVVSEWDVEASGDLEITITSPTPLQEIIFDVLDATPIIDRETYEGLEDGSEVIGTGPFVWAEYSAGTELKLTRNENYRDPELPYLDAVETVVINDSTAQLSALRSGRTHLAGGLTVQDSQTVGDGEAFHLETNHGLIYVLGLDVTKPPFDQLEARQAVGYALDRERINEQIFGGLATPTTLMWHPKVTGYPEDLAGTYAYDPDRARQMIESAGATGAQVTIAIHAQPVPRSIYEIIARNLEDAGLSVSAEELSTADYAPRRLAGELGQAFLSFSATLGFPASLMLSAQPDIRPDKNSSNFVDETYQRLVRELQESPDDDTTAERLRALTEYMQEVAFVHPYIQSPATSIRANAVTGMERDRYGVLLQAASLQE